MSAAAIRPISSARAIALVGRGVFIETVRRNEFYALLILTGLLAVGAAVAAVVGVENASTATFLLNLGMMFAAVSAHFLAILTAARQVPGEIETRQIYPLLAKPLARSHYIIGKWAASAGAGVFSLAVLMALAWGIAPKRESFDAALLLQALALLAVSIGALAAVAMLLSLVAPKGINLVLCAFLFLAGDTAAGFLSARAAGGPLHEAARWVGGYIPDFGDFNLVTRYTDGIGALGAGEFLGLAAYGAIIIAASLAAATAIFDRRAL